MLAVLLVLAFLLETIAFFWACSLSTDEFRKQFLGGDTEDYVRVAKGLLISGMPPIGESRTVGYPLFLAACLGIGGEKHGYRFALAVQLCLNMVFLSTFWSFLARIGPHTRLAIKITMAAVFFLAGFGMAMRLLSDFQAALLFTLFLYGLCFGRSRRWGTGTGVSLGLTLLTRPTFLPLVILLPLLPFFVRRFASRVPWSHIVVCAGCGLAAATVGWWQEQRSARTVHAGMSLRWQLAKDWVDEVGFHGEPKSREETARRREAFNARIAAIAGRPVNALTRGEIDAAAGKILREIVMDHPRAVAVCWAKRFVKSLFVPIEQVVRVAFAAFDRDDAYVRLVRGPLFVLCFPLWVLALAPPPKDWKQQWAFYLFTILLVFYDLGINAIGGGAQGERYRFPVLPLMLIWAGITVEAACCSIRLKATGARVSPTQ
ncbi:MAG: hypothetical protein ABR915_09630 [Thermoguttaceae bacterium]|jgi:hypothetical protein